MLPTDIEKPLGKKQGHCPPNDVNLRCGGGSSTAGWRPAVVSTFVDMTSGEHSDLIAAAAAVLNPHRVGDRLFGNVAAALKTPTGDVFNGVCIDTGSGTGFCAEHSAVASMVTAGYYRITEVVAVWRDDADRLHVLPPCGRCREFMRQIDERNLDADVVLGPDEAKPLSELLPLHQWPDPVPD